MYNADVREVRPVWILSARTISIQIRLSCKDSLPCYMCHHWMKCAHYTANRTRPATNYANSHEAGSHMQISTLTSRLLYHIRRSSSLWACLRNYDTLTEEAIKRKCPTTGKEITDPAVCLFCGAIFCSQAVCCMKDKSKGGCFQHMKKCGGKVGVYINIRKCMVLLMHGPGNGSYAQAPYLDKHGEPDPTLRRHHQLFLNQRRYDKLIRDVWLQHLIPTVISRKLEGDINPGGWETL